jgi:hypothetical protein
MSAASPLPPPLPQWVAPKETEYELPWADLSTIDMSTYDEPGGKEKLAKQLEEAVNLPRSHI